MQSSGQGSFSHQAPSSRNRFPVSVHLVMLPLPVLSNLPWKPFSWTNLFSSSIVLTYVCECVFGGVCTCFGVYACVCLYIFVFESLTSKCMYVLKIRKVLNNFCNCLGYSCLDVLNPHCYDYKNIIMQTCKSEVWSTLFSDVWNLVVATTLNDTAQEPQVKIEMFFDSGHISCHYEPLGSVKKVIIMIRDLSVV